MLDLVKLLADARLTDVIETGLFVSLISARNPAHVQHLIFLSVWT